MTGVYNFTDDAPPQPFIPIVAYWDDENKVPWALPHVYDYMEGRDATRYSYPLLPIKEYFFGRHSFFLNRQILSSPVATR